MLVLSRDLKKASIIIDGNIKITILSIDRKQVKIGIDAPKNIPIMREELLTK